ncbi:MAG: hypothetical protein KAQ74_01065 [Dehalococcoidia bacterium]|nr:hypothetical protein [Dehalococcoidia bacterium]
MKHINRSITHRVLPILIVFLFFTLAVVPPPANAAACSTGCCPVGDYENEDHSVELTITFTITPDEAGYIEVDGEELESDTIEIWQGDEVVLEAVPAKGYEFAGWSGSLTSDDNPLETPFYNHKSLTANFVISEEDEETAEETGFAVSIPDGTPALDADGIEITDVSVHIETPHDIPADMLILGDVYDIEPDGATFDPPLPIILPFNPADVPDGVRDSQLRIAFFDDENETWVEIASVVDEDDMTVSAAVSHLTEFSIMLPKPEDSLPLTASGFSISSPTIAPSAPQVGDTIIVSVATRYGGTAQEATCPVSLTLNGEMLQQKEITLGPGESATVTFSLLAQAEATCDIAVNGMTGTFTVLAATAAPQVLTEAVNLAGAESSPGFFSRLIDRISLPAISSIDIRGDWRPIALIAGALGLVLLGLLPFLRRQILRYRYDI